MIRVGGLWKNKDRNGNTYLAGNLGGLRVMIFPVTEKRGEKSPDYSICFDENKPKEQQDKNDPPSWDSPRDEDAPF